MAQAKQVGYVIGVKETKETLRAQVTEVYRGYCLRVWTEALNFAGVDASLELRRPENVFYPPALRIATSGATERATTLVSLPADQPATTTLPTIALLVTSSSELAKGGENEFANPNLKVIS